MAEQPQPKAGRSFDTPPPALEPLKTAGPVSTGPVFRFLSGPGVVEPVCLPALPYQDHGSCSLYFSLDDDMVIIETSRLIFLDLLCEASLPSDQREPRAFR